MRTLVTWFKSFCITEDRMLRNIYLYVKKMFTNKVNAPLFESERNRVGAD